MHSRAYKTLVSLPPLLWVGLFLLLPYALMFAHSFWAVHDGVLVHQWNLHNYVTLFSKPVYVGVLLRTIRIAASVTLCSLLLGYPLASYLSFHGGVRKELLYQLATGSAENGDLPRALDLGHELANLDYGFRGIGKLLDDWNDRVQNA